MPIRRWALVTLPPKGLRLSRMTARRTAPMDSRGTGAPCATPRPTPGSGSVSGIEDPPLSFCVADPIRPTPPSPPSAALKKCRHRCDTVIPRLKLTISGVVIDGDSLLHLILRKYRIWRLGPDGRETEAWVPMVDGNCGWTTLHVLALVLRYLKPYDEQAIDVTVAFFDSHRPFFPNRPYQLLREVIIRSMASLPRDTTR